jgi:hypothetical protein
LDEWLRKHKIPTVFQAEPIPSQLSYKVLYDDNYRDYRKNNYKTIIKEIAKKHSLNPNKVRPENTHATIEIVSDFLNQNDILWEMFGEKHRQLRLFYDEAEGIKVTGDHGNVYHYRFHIQSSLEGFLQGHGFPHPEKSLPREEGGFSFSYMEDYPWQNFSGLEQAIIEAVEKNDAIPIIPHEVEVEEHDVLTSNKVIISEGELDKIEAAYLPPHKEWKRKIAPWYIGVALIAVAVFLMVVFIHPVLDFFGGIALLLGNIFKWIITIALFVAIAYGIFILMRNDRGNLKK